MDEPVALVLAVPVLALALWALSWFGALSNSQARTVVAAERSAVAAATSIGSEAAATATGIATGDTWPACTDADADVTLTPSGTAAAVEVVCDMPGPIPGSQVCVVGFAQARPGLSGHDHLTCP